MTRKDYRVLADVCSKLPKNEQNLKHIMSLARKLQKDNPRFDMKKFLVAAGVQ